ncbi:MAG: ArgR family transcriptional regulator, partial [Varibaculum cambriense]|nr:ArgR family transcriptional regulator [Varibaculum cambriense]
MATVPTTKAAREEAIREILSQQEISSQSQLLSHLAERGIPTTQATLSRDLLALRATKVRATSGKTVYM